MPHECHPERSVAMNEVNRHMESKDPYLADVAVSVQAILMG